MEKDLYRHGVFSEKNDGSDCAGAQIRAPRPCDEMLPA
jgi:hypothetical protein